MHSIVASSGVSRPEVLCPTRGNANYCTTRAHYCSARQTMGNRAIETNRACLQFDTFVSDRS